MSELEPGALAATRTGEFAATDLPPKTRIAERYRVERLLGMGAMGLVYEAWDEQLGVRVALKVLRPELARKPDAFARFRQELLLARQVSSPHVVRIHDLVQHGESWMISMDFIAGQSLEQRIDQGTPLPLEEALRITRQLALGLAAAQARGVVHRDLKPANVLLDTAGNAYISDFGVARAAGATRMTGTGMVVGTPDYLSPEQARADELDGRSDQYALGLILREMLTGKLPFSGGTAAEMLTQRVLNEAPSIATVRNDLPMWVVTLADRLLRRRAIQRFADSAEIAAIIDQTRIAPPPGEPMPRRTFHWVAAALLLGAIVGTLWFTLRPKPEGSVVTAPVAPALDLAVLPFATTPGVEPERATALTTQIGERLLGVAEPTSADPLRVQRALTALGLDAANANDHLDLVARELGTARVLSGSLMARDGHVIARLRLSRGSDGEAQWELESAALDGAAGAANQAQFLTQVFSRLGVTVPESATTEHLSQAIDFDGRSGLDAPADFWSALAELENQARTLDARALSRKLLDALGDAPSPAWVRVHAYAALLVGDAKTTVRLLGPVVQQVPHDHPARLLLARAHAETGAFDPAVADLRVLVAEDERNIEAWFLLGKFAIMRGDAKTAVDEYLVRAMVLAKRFNDVRWRAEIANAFGVGYRNLGQMPEAAEEYERAIRERAALKDARGEAVSRRNLSVVLAFLGRHDAAAAELAAARTLLEPLGDAQALADLVNDVGVLAEERGDYRNALDAYREALGFRQTQGDQRLIGESLINVGFAYFQVGEFDNAVVYWQHAEQVYAAIDDASGAVRAEQSLALAMIAKGDLVNARTALEANLHRAEEMQMAEERAVALLTIADLDRLEGRYTDATAQLQQARALFVALDDQRGRIEADLIAIQTSLDIGDASSASAVIAALGATDIGSREHQAMLWQRRAALASLEGQFDIARQHAAEALKVADASRSLGHALLARILLAEAEFALAKPEAARAALVEAHAHLARYASVPLRLRLLEADIRVDPALAAVRYREAQAELARWPRYGRAALLHLAAARSLAPLAPAQADAARAAARDAARLMRAAVPAASGAANAAWLARLGLIDEAETHP
jgi:tetratricopeptide (TPR) repeat protein